MGVSLEGALSNTFEGSQLSRADFQKRGLSKREKECENNTPCCLCHFRSHPVSVRGGGYVIGESHRTVGKFTDVTSSNLNQLKEVVTVASEEQHCSKRSAKTFNFHNDCKLLFSGPFQSLSIKCHTDLND